MRCGDGGLGSRSQNQQSRLSTAQDLSGIPPSRRRVRYSDVDSYSARTKRFCALPAESPQRSFAHERQRSRTRPMGTRLRSNDRAYSRTSGCKGIIRSLDMMRSSWQGSECSSSPEISSITTRCLSEYVLCGQLCIFLLVCEDSITGHIALIMS